MTSTLPGADVRGFYAALGIELPAWAKQEAPVGCFADPDAHVHGDRDPSCSVNVEMGVWHCWGCGAAGGAYDAALARGLSRRDAIELMIAHGLTTRRTAAPSRCRPSPPTGREAQARERPAGAAGRIELEADERQLADARARLAALIWPPRVLRPEQARVWSRATLLELGCGWERGRVTIPIRNRHGELRGRRSGDRLDRGMDRAPFRLHGYGLVDW